MLDRRGGALLALLLVAPAFAGCADEAAPSGDKLSPGSSSGGTGSRPSIDVPPPAPKPKPTSERWHFHDHWQGTPTITLYDLNTTLNATMGEDGKPVLSTLVVLPSGTIVPPETGTVTVEAYWAAEAQGLLNMTYRPADSNDFQPGGDLTNGGSVNVSITESMADVPHRRLSLWAWNFTAMPGGTPPTVPAKDVRIVIKATIGRPLFIDPPHLDWWQGVDMIPLVVAAKGAIETASTPAGNLTLPGDPATAKPGSVQEPVRVPADPGRIVPEGSRSIIVMLNWTSAVPSDAALVVHYREANLGTAGALDLKVDAAGSRLFALTVDNDQTDTTYSNRTTWEFYVVPEETPGAFHGSFELNAWVARLEPDNAVARLN